MTEVILEEIDDDSSEDSMEDNFDDSLEDSAKGSLKNKIILKIKSFIKLVFGTRKRIIIIAISIILIISLVIGIWIFFLKKGPDGMENTRDYIGSEETFEMPLTREEEIIFEDIVELEPFERIPLKASSTMSLISVNMSLELIDHRYRKQIYTMEDRIRKIITGQVEEMTWLVLRNPEGKIMLKYNLLKRINSIFPKPVVRNIYFTLFIMQ